MGRTVSVSLRAEIGDFVGKLGTAARSAKQFGTELDGMGKKSPKALNDVSMAAAGAGTALLGIAGYAVSAAMDFDKGMSQVSAATKASAADMGLLRAAALQAGKDTVFSATGAAQAQTELAKAGVSVRDILGGGLTGALNLAAAGTMEVGQAAELAATAMNQFGLAGKDIPHVADLLAAGAGKAQGEVSDMGMALKQSGLVAHQYGISIEETTGTLASFASAGLIGSDAGTSFKTMLLALANPTKKAQTQLDQLGISAYDAQGKFVGISDLASQLQSKMAGLSQEERNAALATIFGSDAIRAASVLYQQGGAGIQKWTRDVNEQGYAADQAARKTDNLAGDVERLKGSLETLMIQGGSGPAGGLRFLTEGLDTLVGQFAAAPGYISGTVVALAGLSGAGLLAFAAFAKVKSTGGDALQAIRDMGPAGEKAATGMGKLAAAAGRAAVVLGAFQLASAAIGSDLNPRIDAMAASLTKYGTTGEKTGEANRVLGDSFEDLSDSWGAIDTGFFAKVGNGIAGFVEGITGMGSVMDDSLQHSKERITGVSDALAQMVASGHADEAAAAFKRFAADAQKHGISMEELKAGMPSYMAALDGAANSTAKAGVAEDQAATSATRMALSMQSAIIAGQGMKDVFDGLNGANLNLAQAQLNVEQSTRGMDAALKDSAGSLDITTEKGGAAAQAAMSLAKADGDVLQKMQEHGANAVELGHAYDDLRQKFIDHIATAGGTRKATDETRQAAKALADQWLQMPPAVTTPVSAPGLPQTKAEAAEHYRLLQDLDRQAPSTPVSAPGLAASNADARDYFRNLDNLNGKTIHTYVINTIAEVHRTTYTTEGGPPSSFFRGNRWGGAFEPAAVGKLRDAAMYASTNPGRYMIAEPQTGGEAFVPKYGNRARSLGILSKAASWYGANISTGGTSGGTYAPTFQVNVNAGMGTDGREVGGQIVAALKQYEKSNGTTWRALR